jgi:hypothetical protein
MQMTRRCRNHVASLVENVFIERLQKSFDFQFKLISSFLFIRLRNFVHEEIQKESATSKKSKQILGGCYMGAPAIGKTEEICNRISIRKYSHCKV